MPNGKHTSARAMQAQAGNVRKDGSTILPGCARLLY